MRRRSRAPGEPFALAAKHGATPVLFKAAFVNQRSALRAGPEKGLMGRAAVHTSVPIRIRTLFYRYIGQGTPAHERSEEPANRPTGAKMLVKQKQGCTNQNREQNLHLQRSRELQPSENALWRRGSDAAVTEKRRTTAEKKKEKAHLPSADRFGFQHDIFPCARFLHRCRNQLDFSCRDHGPCVFGGSKVAPGLRCFSGPG